MRNHQYAVYILASTDEHLYIGVTGNLEHRVATTSAHITSPPSRPATRIDRLLHIEHFGDIRNAMAHEKELKTWTRQRK